MANGIGPGAVFTMAFGLRGALLALPSSAFLAALLVLPSTTDAQLSWRSPHGIYDIDDSGRYGTNPAIDGLRRQVRWSDVETSEGVYDFTALDKIVSDANTIYHKQVQFSMWTLTSPPDWLLGKPGIQQYTINPKGTGATPIVLPWDTVAQPYIRGYIAAFCKHFDGQIDGIVMGELGTHTETYMPAPTDLTPHLHDSQGTQLTLAQEAALWIRSSRFFIRTYAANLHYAPFIMAGGVPFPDTDSSGSNIGTDAITFVFNYGLQYGAHFGVMQWGLSVNSSPNYIINSWIYDYSSTNPVGFQFTGNSEGTVGGDLGCVGQRYCVSQVLDVGIGLKAQWIEVYPVDASNSALAQTFEDHAAMMPRPPAPP